MTNSFAFTLFFLLILGAAVDFLVYGGSGLLFLARQFGMLVYNLTFWR